MLPHDRQEAIITEEAENAFREQIRNATKPRLQKILDRLNTPLVLWLLSSVLSPMLLRSESNTSIDLHFEIDTLFKRTPGPYVEYNTVNLLSMLALSMFNAPDNQRQEIGRAREEALRLTKQLVGLPPRSQDQSYLAQIEMAKKNFKELYLRR